MIMTDYHTKHFPRIPRPRRHFTKAFVFMMGSMFLLSAYGIALIEEKQEQSRQLDCRTCHSHIQAFEEYFRKAGSKDPKGMAEAVSATRNPKLMAAIAKVESGGNTSAVNKHSKARGAFQVKEKYWGKVKRNDAVEQALQAEAILDELTQTMPLKKALNHYGGDSRGRYAKTVLAELERTP